MSDLVDQLRKNGKDLLHAGAIDAGLPDDGDLMIAAADRIDKQEILIEEITVLLERRSARIEELEADNKALKGCLGDLVALKNHKDKIGKTLFYGIRQPMAWEKAKELIKEHGKDTVDLVERIKPR